MKDWRSLLSQNFEAKEYSIDMVEYHNDWTEDDFYNFLLKHAEEQ